MQLQLDKKIKLDKDAILSSNLADQFEEKDLNRIAEVCLEGYEKDRRSRSGWLRRTEAAMDLAMQVSEEKSFPWPNASNVIFPLVTIAALQFHARAYPEIIQGTEVVKCRVPGYAQPQEVDACERIGKFMSYQLLEEDESWEEQHDRLLLNLGIVGCAFKKSYYNATSRANASQLVLARDLVVDYFAKSIDTARRKTQVCLVYRNEVWERAARGIYRDVRKEAWFEADAQYLPDAEEEGVDARSGMTKPSGDHAAPFRCLEQHTWLDLDGDGYDEPYIVLIEEGSGSVLRIVSRCDRVEDVVRDARGKVIQITAGEYFTKYGFIPSPDGGIYDIGFGVLLGPLNESVNSLINQLVDAGTMANTAGGFLGRGAKIRGGVYNFSPMEWKRVDSTGDDLKKSIFPLPVREPSNVLFQLLSLLINYTQRISGSTETLAGENPGQNTKVGTVDTLVEQGLKIYGAIFKRVWRSMKQEFQKLYNLNGVHLPNTPSRRGGVTISRQDFVYGDPKAIVPVADPNVVSDRLKVQQALTIAERAQAMPGYDVAMVEKNLLKTLQVEAPERFYVGVEKTGTPQDPKLALEQEKTKREGMKLKLQAQMFSLEIEEQHWLNQAQIQQLEAAATKLLAESQGVNVEMQIQAINSAVGALRSHNEQLHERARIILEATNRENGGDQSRHVQHLVRGPGDPAIPAAPPIPAGVGKGAVG